MPNVLTESEQANIYMNESLRSALDNENLEHLKENVGPLQTIKSVLPWRQPTAEEVRTDCCTRTQAMSYTESKSNAAQTNSEETDTEPNLISLLTNSCMESSASIGQIHKLTSIHCEQEYAMHHRETTYAHHKPCLDLHVHQQICTSSYGNSRSSFVTENERNNLTQFQNSLEETDPSKNDTYFGAPLDSVHDGPHFRDVYPHHHHHRCHHPHHHSARKPLCIPCDGTVEANHFPCHQIRSVIEQTSGLLTQGKLKRFNGFYIPRRLDPETEFEAALLRMRVREWLNGLQDCV